tara:strand:- start:774 stop:902 length:129 start_codon:yes stop_codon:yes gene_type:complete
LQKTIKICKILNKKNGKKILETYKKKLQKLQIKKETKKELKV